jgi:hypothetical protein
MFNSAILDVVIGVAFVFLLVSTLCASIREGLESYLKTRSSFLEYAIRELLHDRSGQRLTKAFFNHPMIHGLYQGDYEPKPYKENEKPAMVGKNLPSYIPSRTFALAIMDIAARGPVTDAASSDPAFGKVTFESLRASVGNLQNPYVQRVLLSAFDTAHNDLDTVRQNLEDWYNGAMDRVSGWYKRNTQKIVLLIATLVVGALNINTFVIAEHLYRDETLRKTVIEAAQSATAMQATNATTGEEQSAYEKASQSLTGLGLPIGWGRGWQLDPSKELGAGTLKEMLWNDVVGPFLGLLVTAFAAMLGAPFWFDMLNKVMVIRATVKPREKSQEEGSEDRLQTTTTKAVSKDRPRISAPPPSGQPAEARRISSPPAAAARPQLDEEDLERDGCDHDTATDDDKHDGHFTNDEDLPAAQGGVA